MDDREKYKKGVIVENKEEKKKVNDLMWEAKTKENKDLIKGDFSVAVTNPKGGVHCLD